MKEIESPSQKIEFVDVKEYASEAKLITGAKLLITKISGENEEQPPPAPALVVHDSTFTLAPSIKVLVVNWLEFDLTPTGTPSM